MRIAELGGSGAILLHKNGGERIEEIIIPHGSEAIHLVLECFSFLIFFFPSFLGVVVYLYI